MLRSLRSFMGYGVMATDGDIGVVSDFFFDDASWRVRYLIVDTGNWLSMRRVLVPPAAFAKSSESGEKRVFSVTLLKDQVRNSPDIDTQKPVSRQMEETFLQHYGFPYYWASIPAAAAGTPLSLYDQPGDVHLRSFEHVCGYSIQATDGHIGHLRDFILDDTTWTIRYLVIDTGAWLADRKVLVSVQWVTAVNWGDNDVVVDATKDQVKGSPHYNPSDTINRGQEEVLFDYYGRPHYWQ